MAPIRGHSFAACSTAIAAAVLADVTAREEREVARQWRNREAVRAVIRNPDKIAMVEPRT
ncbi:MAG TPA: hypothetical protein VND88_04050 [Candidatus Acidoferrales bacterium]|nr:hypothetical protein [Candidatus Acidoferrales bacterium]